MLVAITIALLTFGSSLGLGFSKAQGQEDTLEGLQVRWTELQIQYAKKEAEIAAGGENAKQLQSEYRDLIAQGNELIGKMRKMALANLKEKPGDTNTLRLLMGILVNDVSTGEEQSVLRVGDELISLGINPLYFETAAKAERLSIAGREIFEELVTRQREFKQDDLPRVQLETTKGNLVVELYENQAPNTVKNFVSLVESGHYTDIQFHRVIDGFMAQAGQNKGDGKPVPELGYTIACECYTPETRRHFSDCISMALDSRQDQVIKDSGCSQFFITFSRRDNLDGQHTCFGRVIEGAPVLETIARTASSDDTPIPNITPDRILSAKVLRKRDHEYKPTKLGQTGNDKSAEDKPEDGAVSNDSAEIKDEDKPDSSGSKDEAEASEPKDEGAKQSEDKKSENKDRAVEDTNPGEAEQGVDQADNSDLELPDSSDGG
jgi:cyclophilin family peptidyl-prolyl cis-trans isomerase